MQPTSDPRLDLAYKYPFLKEAKAFVSEANPQFEEKFLKEGKLRLEEALAEKKIAFQKANIGYVKYAYLMSYIYARMLASALKSKANLSRYVIAEARRATEALRDSSPEEFLMVADELNSGISRDGTGFSIRFEKFLAYAPKRKEFSLPLQELQDGKVHMSDRIALGVLRGMIREEIARNLPIPLKDLPKQVVDYARDVKVPEVKLAAPNPDAERRHMWIEKLLSMPIGDVRHRTVNLILAPYLTNVRGMSELEASNVIIAYIERCKEIDPNTKVNQSYIRYQCKYSKSKGMKPLSKEKAKELLGSMIDFDKL